MKKIFTILLLAVMPMLVFGQIMMGSMSSRKLNMAIAAIENLYVDEIDDDKLVEDAIIALLKELDPHSNYLNVEEVKEMNEPLQGNFEGIGIQFNMLTDTLYVVSVISGGPSERVGLQAGDRIVMVNDTLIAGVKMKNSDIMSRLRGKKGTTVNVKVLRNNVPELIDFKIVRDKIPIHSLEAAYMIDKETGYIRLNRFAATSHDEFVEALKKLKSKGMKNLIFDLQDNGGGYLNAAIDITNEFLGSGKTIVYTEGFRQRREDAQSSGKGLFETGKLVILINETSASASEIVAGAVQDWDRGVLVGRRTFGKGLVQRPIPLPDGSMIRLTTARYYTPTGRSIQKPYEKGDAESYSRDLAERFNRGEMISADSIHFPDSLRFFTLVNRRVVFGGGGIMPDYFIPLDTTKYTTFHRNVIARGIVNRLVMSYIDKNRAELKAEFPTFKKFHEKYVVSDEMMENLLNKYKEDKATNRKNIATTRQETIDIDSQVPSEIDVVVDAQEQGLTAQELEEFQRSEPLIRLQMKALIARDLWDMNEYFQVWNAENESYRKALEIIRDTDWYNRLLGRKK
ncbi:MAG: S41 family peptidase [Dysgonamonadaceae bacterium]|jgi:carboxyl-terminal processing protease|nr:S41 family peptidase [Dysgonamonadaceae bacterium]